MQVTYGAAGDSFADTYLTAFRLRIISIFSGLFVVFMNWCITLAVRELSFYERWHTQSAREKWHVVKLSVFYLLNSFVVPILATNLSGNASQWYSHPPHPLLCTSTLNCGASNLPREKLTSL